jgi:hypothetical protein
MGQLPAVGHHFHAVRADLLRIWRQHGDAVIVGAEQIAGALVVGHRTGTTRKLGQCGFLGQLAGLDLFLQAGSHVARHVDDRLGLFDARFQHLTLHQMAGENAGRAKAEQCQSHHDAKLRGNLQIVQLHVVLRGEVWGDSAAQPIPLTIECNP